MQVDMNVGNVNGVPGVFKIDSLVVRGISENDSKTINFSVMRCNCYALSVKEQSTVKLEDGSYVCGQSISVYRDTYPCSVYKLGDEVICITVAQINGSKTAAMMELFHNEKSFLDRYCWNKDRVGALWSEIE